MSYYKLITSATVSSPTAQVDFTSIPATYTDLLLYVRARSTAANAIYNMQIGFNGITSGNYVDGMLLFSSGTGSAGAASQPNFTTIDYNYVAGQGAATFNNASIYICSYASSYYKGISIDGSINTTTASTARNHFTQALFKDNTAISSLYLRADNTNFATDSKFWLYGIKNT